MFVKIHTAQSQLSYYIKKKKKSACLEIFYLLHCLNSLKGLHQNVSCNLASDISVKYSIPVRCLALPVSPPKLFR